MCVSLSEGEQEEQWLQDAGLSPLIQEDSEDVDKVVLLSTLTRTQAAAVQRRLDSYTCSLRKKNKPPPRDVRDIFNPPRSQVRTFISIMTVLFTVLFVCFCISSYTVTALVTEWSEVVIGYVYCDLTVVIESKIFICLFLNIFIVSIHIVNKAENIQQLLPHI